MNDCDTSIQEKELQKDNGLKKDNLLSHKEKKCFAYGVLETLIQSVSLGLFALSSARKQKL